MQPARQPTFAREKFENTKIVHSFVENKTAGWDFQPAVTWQC